MNSENIKTEISQYLSRFFPEQKIEEDDDIFELGFATSIFAMQLVAFVEQKFDIVVENEDLNLDNFRSVNGLHRFVSAKLSVSPTA